MIYLTLIWEFLQVGLFSIGGGLATLPFLYGMTDRYPWFTREMLTNMIAISQSTPGPIGLNMATYAGYAAAGALGGVVASLALITPSIVIALVIVRILDHFRTNKYVAFAFYGIRPAVTALIAFAVLGIAQVTLLRAGAPDVASMFDYRRIALFLLLVVCIRKFKKRHSAWFLLAGAVAGLLFKL